MRTNVQCQPASSLGALGKGLVGDGNLEVAVAEGSLETYSNVSTRVFFL